MIQKQEDTYWVYIYISGDINIIKHICREYVMKGLCVTVEPIEYIYTGGEEGGVRIGLINYPRFPDSKENIWNSAIELAKIIRSKMFQYSVLIMDNEKCVWISYRDEN